MMELGTIKSVVMDKLMSGAEYARFGWNNPRYSQLETPARAVMSAYQNANRWLDTIKEYILIDLNLPYFSHIVHELAHTMPGRFDKFGDILHKENLSVPYPGTEEWTNPCGDIKNCINIIYDILDQISASLVAFRKVADMSVLFGMSIACDELIADIQREYEFYHRVEGMLDYFGLNLSAWDKHVHQYYAEKDSLI